MNYDPDDIVCMSGWEVTAIDAGERIRTQYAKTMATVVELARQLEDGQLHQADFLVLFWGAEETLSQRIREIVMMTVGDVCYAPRARHADHSNVSSTPET